MSDNTENKINNLTPRQVRFINLISLWLIIAGSWKTVECVVVFFKWFFR